MDSKQRNAKPGKASENKVIPQPAKVRPKSDDPNRGRKASVPSDARNSGTKRRRRANASQDARGNAASDKQRPAAEPGGSGSRPGKAGASRASKAWKSIKGWGFWQTPTWKKVKLAATILATFALMVAGAIFLIFRKSDSSDTGTASAETDKRDKDKSDKIQANSAAQKKAKDDLWAD